jgi:hypothetical protein
MPSEFRNLHERAQFCFESVLGMGFGHWNYIVEENVEDAMILLEDLIKYSVTLPKRMREAVFQERRSFSTPPHRELTDGLFRSDWDS